YSNVFATEADAKAMLEQLTQKARGIESDPCEIKSNITKTAEGYALTVDFAFACEAETLIFQLGLR
ncbi:MAG: YfcZ/YiiS family protein, partial [Enterobacterales bacterium]|nr:YfcZ/YiiS family protein [Enterobacterales bacterium]